ncbi:hypothetical protein M2H09_22415 [Vibrio vulnificus]|uniref:hypothetical protein n=2 Tax=Vibrio vulnificus TaxID=672 RepID=UPI001302D347|nr:hypothetical protein [Vibrio vulnificus]EJE8558813.1 hypothetical protein [Vibrio vulnificus]MCU8208055.1 hypothetical protein [Vibrio vulnificus]
MKIRDLGNAILDFELQTIPKMIAKVPAALFSLAYSAFVFTVETYVKLFFLVFPLALWLLYYNEQIEFGRRWAGIKIIDGLYVTEAGLAAVLGMLVFYVGILFWRHYRFYFLSGK